MAYKCLIESSPSTCQAIPGGPKAPSPTVRVLGVLLDSKLRWGPHIRRTSDRATQQCRALTALSGSTWGASFAKARLIYSAVVRPCLTYGATIWAPLEGTLRPAKRQWIGEPLERIRQQCLRAVTGAFKATPRQTRETEAAIPPLRAHIARLQLQSRARLEASGARQEIDRACRRLRSHLAPHHGPHRPAGPTPGKARRTWARNLLWRRQQRMEDISSNLGLPPWSDNPHPDPPPPHSRSGGPTNWLSNGAGTGGRKWKEAHPHPTETPPRTPGEAGNLTKCRTKQQPSGYTPTSRSPTAASSHRYAQAR